MKRLTLLICTHNRWQLLEQLLNSLNAASRPESWEIGVLVAANACSDETHQFLQIYPSQPSTNAWLKIDWFAEPIAGKSHALNSAIKRVEGDLIALVDDDQRIATDFLINLSKLADRNQDISIFCGKLIPDWDGTEPAWMRQGPYTIYPLPVPYFEPAKKECAIFEGDLPPGGNLFVRREVFDRAGGFSTELGPQGHNLGGGEDTAFILKALSIGERILYSPDVVQFHYVDPARLKLGFLMRFAYQRTYAAVRLGSGTGKMPAYVWRKLATYATNAIFSFASHRRQFYLIRTAAAIGEIKGLFKANASARRSYPQVKRNTLSTWMLPVLTVAFAGYALHSAHQIMAIGLPIAAYMAALCVAMLLIKSILNFSRTGPQLKSEIFHYYLPYSIYALLRLGVWSFMLCFLMALAGIVFYFSLAAAFNFSINREIAAGFGLLGIVITTAVQFCRHLLHIPGSIEASSNYRMSRFYAFWTHLTPERIERVTLFLLFTFAIASIAGGGRLGLHGQMESALGLISAATLFLIPALFWRKASEPRPICAEKTEKPPNILMIGSDSLRSDRLGVDGNTGGLTPVLDDLANRGIFLQQCYVPCARTAPSLASLLTGLWPHSHGIRDNFSTLDESNLGHASLPQVLNRHGYHTTAISDWCGADLGKFSFGFKDLDIPKDQWNIRYLIRQGPKDIRLFLSLFTHNEFGRRFLPELYYLAGVPMTSLLGKRTRSAISRAAQIDKPFFMNVFMSSTHAPFGSEYPYYAQQASREYFGCSKFVMSGLNEPFEVIQRQKQVKEFFDFEQILNLYDGCVRNFDNEVGHILKHLDQCGLTENTIVVIYSDHGMEFFERKTWGQGNSVIVDDSSRIPLIITDPRASMHHTIKHTVRSIDLAPTLLDMVGLPIPAVMQGVSLKSSLGNKSVDPGLVAYTETGIWVTRVPSLEENHITYPDLPDLLEIPDKQDGTLTIKTEYRALIASAKDRMVRTDRWKLVYQPMHNSILYSLFDLNDDPACLNDVAARHPEIMLNMRALLEQRLVEDPLLQRETTHDGH